MGSLEFRCTESDSAGFNFYTGSGTSEPTTKMIITNYGNVGIGTSSPIAPLHVLGGVGLSATSEPVNKFCINFMGTFSHL